MMARPSLFTLEKTRSFCLPKYSGRGLFSYFPREIFSLFLPAIFITNAAIPVRSNPANNNLKTVAKINVAIPANTVTPNNLGSINLILFIVFDLICKPNFLSVLNNDESILFLLYFFKHN